MDARKKSIRKYVPKYNLTTMERLDTIETIVSVASILKIVVRKHNKAPNKRLFRALVAIETTCANTILSAARDFKVISKQ